LATDVHLFSLQFLDAERLARFHRRPWQSTDPELPALLQELTRGYDFADTDSMAVTSRLDDTNLLLG